MDKWKKLLVVCALVVTGLQAVLAGTVVTFVVLGEARRAKVIDKVNDIGGDLWSRPLKFDKDVYDSDKNRSAIQQIMTADDHIFKNLIDTERLLSALAHR